MAAPMPWFIPAQQEPDASGAMSCRGLKSGRRVGGDAALGDRTDQRDGPRREAGIAVSWGDRTDRSR